MNQRVSKSATASESATGGRGRRGGRTARTPPGPGDRRVRRVVNTLALAISLYSLFGWIYVAAVSLATPQTLPLQLTHLASWPRTDTFGEACFVVSFLAFIAYRLTGESR